MKATQELLLVWPMGYFRVSVQGTFLFVVFFEILPRELHCHRRLDGALNLMFTTLGFGLMAGLQAIGSHDHEAHGHMITRLMVTDQSEAMIEIKKSVHI